MAKIIKYKFKCNGNDDDLNDKIIKCKTQAIFDANYPIAEKEAVGEIIVEGEFDPEPEIPESGDVVTWDELDAAYEAGYDEGYTEGVNSAYDQ